MNTQVLCVCPIYGPKEEKRHDGELQPAGEERGNAGPAAVPGTSVQGLKLSDESHSTSLLQ